MIHCNQDGGTWTVTIDRPDKAGALTREMLTELADIAEAAQSAKLFILTGTGPVFSAGADLEAARAGLATDPVWERLSGGICTDQSSWLIGLIPDALISRCICVATVPGDNPRIRSPLLRASLSAARVSM